MESNKNNKLEVVEVANWPQAVTKSVELFLNRSVIGAIFILFMVGVYYVGQETQAAHERQIQAHLDLLRGCMEQNR